MRTEQLRWIQPDAPLALDFRTVGAEADERDAVVALRGDEEEVSGWRLVIGRC
jgi:hypothetical protein